MKDQIARIIDPACWPPEGGFRQYQLTRNMDYRRADSLKKAEGILKVVLAGSKAGG